MKTTDYNSLRGIFASEESFHVLVDMISDLDLEVVGTFAL